jgi:hypothetical protein
MPTLPMPGTPLLVALDARKFFYFCGRFFETAREGNCLLKGRRATSTHVMNALEGVKMSI